jgi:hypothetical protein
MKDINKILAKTLQMQKKVKTLTFLRKHVSLSCLDFSFREHEGEVKSYLLEFAETDFQSCGISANEKCLVISMLPV